MYSAKHWSIEQSKGNKTVPEKVYNMYRGWTQRD